MEEKVCALVICFGGRYTEKQLRKGRMSIVLSRKKIAYCAAALLGSGILAFGIYEIHAISAVTEGGVLGLTLLLDHWFLTIHALVWHMLLVFIGLFICFSKPDKLIETSSDTAFTSPLKPSNFSLILSILDTVLLI